jgi:hypothetical protein
MHPSKKEVKPNSSTSPLLHTPAVHCPLTYLIHFPTFYLVSYVYQKDELARPEKLQTSIVLTTVPLFLILIFLLLFLLFSSLVHFSYLY